MSIAERIRTTSDREVELQADQIDRFAASLRGGLLQRSDPSYDEARQLWNGMIDKHPALIARCTDR